MGKGLYIYFGEKRDEYADDATFEIADRASGSVYAFISSPKIDKIFRDFICNAYRIRSTLGWDSPQSVLTEILATLDAYPNRRVPFICLHKQNNGKWVCLERRIVDGKTARNFML